MSKLPQARVQLLDKNGQPISDVDVLSIADLINYKNLTPTVTDFRGIPKGTTFDDDSNVGEVLTALLYPNIEPKVLEVSGGIKQLSTPVIEDTVIFCEKYIEIGAFTLNINILAGDKNQLTLTFKHYDKDSAKVKSTSSVITVTPGSAYMASFDIDTITDDRSYQLEISDGEFTIQSPMITFKFVDPVFIGLCTNEMVVNGLIDAEKAHTYFDTLIMKNDRFITKTVSDIRNFNGINILDPIYANTERYPFILYPNEFGKIQAIRDANGLDITGSFRYAGILTRPSADALADEQYTVYISREPYRVGLYSLKEIQYNFVNDSDVQDGNMTGSPMLAGADVFAKVPIDYRTKVNTVNELDAMEYKYEGLVTYVAGENAYFKYTNGEWSPYSQQVFLEYDENKKVDDYDLTIGQWGDIIINLANGQVVQKLENRRWELKGKITVESMGAPIPKMAMAAMTLSDEETPTAIKSIQIRNTYTTAPGNPAEIKNVGNDEDMVFDIYIPRGYSGNSSTIEVGTVKSGPVAKVLNSGTQENAKFDFIIPSGADGKPGKAATIRINEIKVGESFYFENIGNPTNAVFNITVPKIPTAAEAAKEHAKWQRQFEEVVNTIILED